MKSATNRTDALRAKMRALVEPSSIDPAITFAVKHDTREQKGWNFSPTVPMVLGTLQSGDYSVVGHEDEVAIERKSLDDLVGSITWGNGRFQRELERLTSFRLAAVMIEASPGDVYRRAYYAKKVEPEQIFDIVATLHVKHNVPFMFGGTRPHAAQAALRLLHSFWLTRRQEIADEKRRDIEARLLAEGKP